MRTVAAVISSIENSRIADVLRAVRRCEAIRACAIAVPDDGTSAVEDLATIRIHSHWSRQAIIDLLEWFRTTGADHLLLLAGPRVPVLNPEGLRRMVACSHDTCASIVYGDYYDTQEDGGVLMHPLADYQPGSVRDSFDFGPAILINGTHAGKVSQAIRAITPDVTYAGLYDLRLRLTESAPVRHLPEPLYTCAWARAHDSGSGHFAYVDPRNRDYQIEMETIATAHLQRIGALVVAPANRPLEDTGTSPVTASVVIPVRNRASTVGDAVKSALSQITTFDYNVIVVDNHSTDGTTDILAETARGDTRLVHRVPERRDLLIGGCWNEAIYSSSCGTYAIQLDSDDLYDGTDVLERIVAEFRKGPLALVVGSYTIVNFALEPIAPGLIDHREWTDTNGPNNALRIAGLGAPRAFHVPTLRRFGFPNVSYGEDYAVVLRLCRTYAVGRIYDSLYWCRRWEGNSDSALPLETANRYDSYKDHLRTIEIAARIRKEDCR